MPRPSSIRTWLLFGAFCLLSSLNWLLPSQSADAGFSLAQSNFAFAVVSVAGLLFARGSDLPREPWTWQFRVIAASIGLLGLPVILVQRISSGLSDVTVISVFALVPAVVILAAAQTASDDAGERSARDLLAPAIVAYAGLLFVIPSAIPVSTQGRLLLALACGTAVMVGLSSTWIYGPLQRFSIPQALALICLPNALVLFLDALLSGEFHFDRSELTLSLLASTAVHAAGLALLVVLLRTMPPTRLASRYLVAPLLTVLEGYVLYRPHIIWQTALGFFLAFAGMAWFFYTSESGTGEGSSLSLR